MLLFKRNIPSGYTQLDYIESTGTQYIELPFGFEETDIIDFDMSENTGQDIDKYMVAPKLWNDNSNRFGMGVHGSVYCSAFGSLSTGNTKLTPETNNDGNRHQWHYENSIFTITDLGLEYNGTSNPFRGATANLKLFYGYNSNTKGKIYRYTHWKNSSKVIDLIPAQRKSDNEIGLYDLVTKTFYTNSGTGSFIAGTEYPITPKKIIYKDNIRNLPNEYTRLNYIQNSGTQYIDTGFIPNYDKNIKVEIETTPTVANRRYCLLSNYIAYKHLSLELQSDKGRAYYNNGQVDKFVGTLSTTEKNTYIFEYDTTNKKYNLTVNGVSINGDMDATGISSSSMLIFVDQYKRFSTFANPLRIYSVKITENDILVRNLVPCIRKANDEVGMYDLVTKTFFANAGSGSFIAGE